MPRRSKPSIPARCSPPRAAERLLQEDRHDFGEDRFDLVDRRRYARHRQRPAARTAAHSPRDAPRRAVAWRDRGRRQPARASRRDDRRRPRYRGAGSANPSADQSFLACRVARRRRFRHAGGRRRPGHAALPLACRRWSATCARWPRPTCSATTRPAAARIGRRAPQAAFAAQAMDGQIEERIDILHFIGWSPPRKKLGKAAVNRAPRTFC